MPFINWRHYYELCKPRVVALMLLTTLVGMLLASDTIDWQVISFGILGIGMTACAGGVLNQLMDRKIDAQMGRTQKRPIPSGNITPLKAGLFAGLLSIAGMSLLLTYVNALTALLTFITLIGYGVIYTVFLKKATPQNIVIGGLAGAMPPLLGWTAVSNHVTAGSLLLVLLIFTWTPPHFWALAIARYEEYKKAKIPMLPVTHGISFTKLCILLYTFLMTVISVLPYVINMCGTLYLFGALCLDTGFLIYSILLLRKNNPFIAMQTFYYSIFYLMMMFLLLLIDHFYTVLMHYCS